VKTKLLLLILLTSLLKANIYYIKNENFLLKILKNIKIGEHTFIVNNIQPIVKIENNKKYNKIIINIINLKGKLLEGKITLNDYINEINNLYIKNSFITGKSNIIDNTYFNLLKKKFDIPDIKKPEIIKNNSIKQKTVIPVKKEINFYNQNQKKTTNIKQHINIKNNQKMKIINITKNVLKEIQKSDLINKTIQKKKFINKEIQKIKKEKEIKVLNPFKDKKEIIYKLNNKNYTKNEIIKKFKNEKNVTNIKKELLIIRTMKYSLDIYNLVKNKYLKLKNQLNNESKIYFLNTLLIWDENENFKKELGKILLNNSKNISKSEINLAFKIIQ